MVIGLTGKSCSGKNYVGQVLEGIGLEVWDTDRMCHDGLNENIRAIVSEFGEGVVQGEIVSRQALGKVVFADPERRRALENILYPWLRKKVEEWIAGNPDGILVLNGALLYRAGFCDMCECVIYVDASYETRLRRAMERDGLDEKAFMLREMSQQDVDFR
ncbi:MAG: dephospho-CoA kinase, partial [Spirochaetales bacterium]|nr:dephospho-CoA kinase [Spirochaetales bacterium]